MSGNSKGSKITSHYTKKIDDVNVEISFVVQGFDSKTDFGVAIPGYELKVVLKGRKYVFNLYDFQCPQKINRQNTDIKELYTFFRELIGKNGRLNNGIKISPCYSQRVVDIL